MFCVVSFVAVVAAAVVEFQVDQLIFQLQFLSGVSGLNATLHSCVTQSKLEAQRALCVRARMRVCAIANMQP